MTEFKQGMKCTYHEGRYNNYPHNSIVTLKKRKPMGNEYFWTVEEGLTGVVETEIAPLTWRERYGTI